MNFFKRLVGVKDNPKEVFACRLQDEIVNWKKRSRGRFELTGHDSLVMIITNISAGIQMRNITNVREPLFALMMAYFSNTKSWMDRSATLAGNPKKAVDSIYRDIQCTIMAYRNDDFIAIQGEPQFSRRTQGKISLVTILSAYLKHGEEGLRAALDEVINRDNQGSNDDSPIRYSGGTGSSMADAVVIHTNDEVWGIEVEYWYLNHTHGRIKKHGQSLRTGADGKHYDVISFDTPEGESKTVYFDISRFYH